MCTPLVKRGSALSAYPLARPRKAVMTSTTRSVTSAPHVGEVADAIPVCTPVKLVLPCQLLIDIGVRRSDGGPQPHLQPPVALRNPCNRAKSNTLTLSGLRNLKRKEGWMAKE